MEDKKMDNKKIYINNLTEEERIKVLKYNKKLYNQLLEDLYEQNMHGQEEEYNLLNIKNYVDIKDHYSSFYIKVENPIGMYENINIDYLNDEALKIYKSVKKYYNYYINTYNDEVRDRNYLKIESLMDKLADAITSQLRLWEDVDDDDIQTYFLDEVCTGSDLSRFKDCYILDKNDPVLYEDVHFTECYL